MYDNYNYPAGANTPSAPWNEKEMPPIEVSVDIGIALSRKAVVETTNYDVCDTDDHGGYDVELLDNYSDLEGLYNNQHYSIPYLLGELAKYINGELQGDISGLRRQELREILADCKGWEQRLVEVEDYEVKG